MVPVNYPFWQKEKDKTVGLLEVRTLSSFKEENIRAKLLKESLHTGRVF